MVSWQSLAIMGTLAVTAYFVPLVAAAAGAVLLTLGAGSAVKSIVKGNKGLKSATSKDEAMSALDERSAGWINAIGMALLTLVCGKVTKKFYKAKQVRKAEKANNSQQSTNTTEGNGGTNQSTNATTGTNTAKSYCKT